LPDGKKGEKGGQKRGSKKCGFLVILVFYPFFAILGPFFDPFGPFHILTGLVKPVKMGLLKCVDISNLNTTF